MTNHLHPVADRPLVLRLLVVAAVVVAVFLLLASAGSADELPAPTTTYVVSAGDTLWEIAASVAPAGADVRDTVDELIALNTLDSATIYPGQAILVPQQ